MLEATRGEVICVRQAAELILRRKEALLPIKLTLPTTSQGVLPISIRARESHNWLRRWATVLPYTAESRSGSGVAPILIAICKTEGEEKRGDTSSRCGCQVARSPPDLPVLGCTTPFSLWFRIATPPPNEGNSYCVFGRHASRPKSKCKFYSSKSESECDRGPLSCGYHDNS